jgi:hypothetical protein
MGKVLSTVLVAVLLTGCAGHVVKPDDKWVGEPDDRTGATAANLVYAVGSGVKCAEAGFMAFIAMTLTFGAVYEDVSRMMHGSCSTDTFVLSSKDIRQAVPDDNWCRQTAMPCK